jgi:hypothetical protein
VDQPSELRFRLVSTTSIDIAAVLMSLLPEDNAIRASVRVAYLSRFPGRMAAKPAKPRGPVAQVVRAHA